MIWGLSGAGATGLARLALALVAVGGVVGAAAPGLAVELGGLQAVPSPVPPYVFRLPLITPPHSPAAPARVTVRQPPDTLAFVKQQAVELRLRALADVELEVSYAGQTLNRLLPKSELHAARVRVDAAPASGASLPARAKERDRPPAEALPGGQVPLGAADRSLIEREMAGIRQEIHSLVERVAPWEGTSPPGGDWGRGGVTEALGLTLGGGFAVGVTSLAVGYLLRRRMPRRERQRRQALPLSVQRVRDRRAGVVPLQAVRQRAPLARATHEALTPVGLVRRVRVAQKTRRRFRLWAPGRTRDVAQAHEAGGTRPWARSSPRPPSAPAELIEALVQLRGELMRLQGGLPMPATPTRPETWRRQTPA